MLGAGWACLTSTNPCGVTVGWTTNEITITADAVLNFETFKCAIKDTDTSAGNSSANKVVCDIISFTDMSDPITVDLVSQKGFTIKNNGNDVDAKAVLYRNGEELDARRHSLHLHVETMEPGRNIGHKDLYGKIHHCIES